MYSWLWPTWRRQERKTKSGQEKTTDKTIIQLCYCHQVCIKHTSWMCVCPLSALPSHRSVGLPSGQGSALVFTTSKLYDTWSHTVCILLCYCTNKSFMQHEAAVWCSCCVWSRLWCLDAAQNQNLQIRITKCRFAHIKHLPGKSERGQRRRDGWGCAHSLFNVRMLRTVYHTDWWAED